jgi:iron complex outermembrane receptor protein
MTNRSHAPGKTLNPLRAAVAFALGSCIAGGALAQNASPQLEEVVVTGTKRDASVQDVPISISTVTADELARSNFNDIRALGQKAPGLVLSNPSGFNAAGGGMRGTGTNIILVTQDAPVSFLIDEFSLSHVTSQFLNLFDIEQVEIYRGPQGTLFGKNATGGVISLTTKRPVQGETSGEIDLTYGQYDASGDPNYGSVKAALNLPVTDTLAFRLAAIYDQDDGYYRNDKRTATFPDNVPIWGAFGIPQGTPLDPSIDANVLGDGSALGGKDVLAAKAKLLWEPTSNFSAFFTYEVVRDNSDTPPGVNESVDSDLIPQLGFPGIQSAGQGDVFSTLITNNEAIDMPDGHQVDVDGYYLNLDWGTDFGTFKSITGYREEDQQFPSTYTGEAFLTLFDSTRVTGRETLSQEFRFVSDFAGPFNFVTGASYYEDKFDFFSFFSVGLTSLLPVPDPDTGGFVTPDGFVSLDTRAFTDYQYQFTTQDREEYGIYWDGSYEFNDQWSVNFGLRYTDDTKEFDRGVDGGAPCNQFTDPRDAIVVDGDCRDSRSQYLSRAGLTLDDYDNTLLLPKSQFGTRVTDEDSWTQTTYRFVVNYQPTDAQLLYLSYATGFISGGFAETCATVEFCAYDPEKNTNIELGWKADLFDNRLRLNAALYNTVYEDLQRAVVAAYTAADGSSQQETVTVNTGESELWGVDIEATWLATANLQFHAAINYMDHEYTEGVLPALRGTGEPTPLEQFDVPFSPEWKFMLSADYRMPTSLGDVVLNASMNHQDEAETDVFNGERTQMEERTLVDASVTLEESAGRWAVSAFAANITDEQYRIAALPVAGLWNFTNYGAPRSFGVRFRYNFGVN